MGEDSFTEVTRTSWGGRLKRSVSGVLIGLLLVVASVVGLFWNEGRAVTTARSLAEGRGLVVDVAAEAPDAANEGALVHLSAPLTLPGPVTDPDFGVEADAVRLVRRVEMYQWKEESRSESKTSLGGGEETVTTYTYVKGWHDEAIDSSSFRRPSGHENPPMPVESRRFQVESAGLGGFTVDAGVLDQLGDSRPLAAPAGREAEIADALGLGKPVKIVGGELRVGGNPSSPVVGDLRIAFSIVPAGPVSVVGRQSGDGLRPYQTESGDRLLMVETGTVPAAEMFANAESANTAVTWVIRLVGILLLFIGFGLVLGPLGVAADVIPILGSLVRLGTGLAAGLLTALLGPATIALAWLWYRPLVAIGVLALGALVAYLFWRRGQAKAGTLQLQL